MTLALLSLAFSVEWDQLYNSNASQIILIVIKRDSLSGSI